jgi:hypothetical protein
VSCYEQFGWPPDTVAALSLQEAERLAIYFEELGAHHYRIQHKSPSSSSSPAYGYVVDLELKDEHYDDPDWWKDDE